MIFHVEVIAHLRSVPINGQRQIVNCISHKQRNALFRVLVRTDVIGAARYQRWQFMGDLESAHEEFSTGFTRRVRTARLKGPLLCPLALVYASVDLVRAHL